MKMLRVDHMEPNTIFQFEGELFLWLGDNEAMAHYYGANEPTQIFIVP